MTVQEMQELYNKGEITFDELDEFVKEDANLNWGKFYCGKHGEYEVLLSTLQSGEYPDCPQCNEGDANLNGE